MTTTPTVVAGEIFEIADALFSSMINGATGWLRLWQDGPVDLADPLYAWVDLEGPLAARALLCTERETAVLLAIALLGMPQGAEVSDDDLVDAFGEVANVVGGNIKSLLPTSGRLTLPTVASEPPHGAAGTDHGAVELDWCGRPIVITVGKLA